jgi:acyl carrier protein
VKESIEFVAPKGYLQMEIAEVWKRILDIEELSAEDNFFAIGGDSLSATRIISACRKIFDNDLSSISLKMFFENQTIAKFSAALASANQNLMKRDLMWQLENNEENVLEGDL